MSKITQALYAVGYSFRFIWQSNKRYLFYSVLIKIFIGILPLLGVYLLKELIDSIVLVAHNKGNISTAIYLLVAQLLIVLGGYLLNFLSEVNEKKLDNLVGLKVKESILNKVNRIPYITFENPVFYDQFQRIHNNQSQIMSIVKDALEFGANLLTIISLTLFLFQIHWAIVLILFVCVIPLFLVELFFGSERYQLMWLLTPYSRKEMYVSHLLSNRQALKEIRLFRLGEHLIEEWRKLFLLNARESLKLVKKQGFWVLMAEIIMSLTYAICGLFIIFLVVGGKILVGEFVAVLQAVQNVQSGFGNSARSLSKFYEGSLYIRDFEEFLSIKELKKTSLIEVREIKKIVVEHLRFQYPNQSTPAIKQMEKLVIQPGKKIAIVGDNGSGKTTFIKCLTGLYHTEPNMIKVNDLSIHQVDLQTYQNRIAALFQDFNKYDFSVRDNIGFGRVEERENLHSIRQAADQMGMDKYISSLPEGYESILGRLFSGGNELSGGQWQKIALARAIFRDSDLIVLDEPTSALDPKAEIEIIENLFQLAEKKAVILVTHRLGAACLADEILVMRDGTVIEQGSHEELLKLQGEYYKMYCSQSQWYRPQEEVLHT